MGLFSRVKSWFKPAQPAITAKDIAEFDEAKWSTPPATTKWQTYAAWTAAGRPEDFRIKTLPSGELLALTAEEYEEASGFTPTEEQMQYIRIGHQTEADKLSEAAHDPGEVVKLQSGRKRTKANVIKVLDGDTIKVNIDGKIRTVRYLGIDTPETVHPSKPIEEGGPEASRANKQLVAGKTVYLEKDISDTDHYGRLLRNVFLEDDTFVNAELVRLGHAKVKTYPPDERYKKRLEEQLQYVYGRKTSFEKKIGIRESRYMDLAEEWTEFKAGELRLEQPTSEQRMASWRRAGEPDPYHQKVYRDDEGKMLGIITMRPDELGALAGFKPSEAQKVWAFRETRGKMRPLEQFGIWASEQVAEEEQDTQLREELVELRRGVKVRKGELQDVLRLGGGGEVRRRRRELEEMLSEGVIR